MTATRTFSAGAGRVTSAVSEGWGTAGVEEHPGIKRNRPRSGSVWRKAGKRRMVLPPLDPRGLFETVHKMGVRLSHALDRVDLGQHQVGERILVGDLDDREEVGLAPAGINGLDLLDVRQSFDHLARLPRQHIDQDIGTFRHGAAPWRSPWEYLSLSEKPKGCLGGKSTEIRDRSGAALTAGWALWAPGCSQGCAGTRPARHPRPWGRQPRAWR